MVDAVLSIALETVRDLLLEEARFLFNVKDEVEEIGTELNRMRNFLERADAKKDEDKALSDRVAEIRGLAAEVEDVLLTFSIEVASQKSRGGIKNALKRSACIVNKCVALHQVGSEIVRIRTKIKNHTAGLATYDIPTTGGESSNSRHERVRQQDFPHFEDDFVGMEKDISKLVYHLINEESQWCKVVSICGMGGLGKTSLAKKVYNHDEVKRHFSRFGWACISQKLKTTNVLQEILKGLVPTDKESIMKMTDPELFEKLYKVQKEEKCLVVIDDIWSIANWDELRQAFPIGNTQTGSKILLTTRYERVALHVDPRVFVHKPLCLSGEESWKLLQKIAFRRRNTGTEYTIDLRMKELGEKMVKQCKGLPLAVVVLGGILVTRHTHQEWEVVLKDIKSYLGRGEGVSEKNGGEVFSVLALSYNSLPYHLKPCFLFLANYPEDSNIKATKLYHLWLAERIVSSDYQRDGQTMMDVAEEYLVELAQRCMVQVRVKKINTARRRLKSCRLHDLMRDLCLSKVKEENFLKIIGNGAANEKGSTSLSSNITKTRRLAIHSNDDVSEYLEKQRASHVRSLLIFNKGVEGFWFNKIKDSLSSFKLLSVLDVEGVDMDGLELPKEIGKVTQLRYLNLRDTRIVKLPTSIGELGYLETLDLKRTVANWDTRRIGIIGMFIPNVLWKLQRLRHLYLPDSIEFDREKEKKLRLDGLNNLETLVGYHSEYFDVKDLLNFNNLQKLYAIVETKHEDLHFSQNLNNLSLTGPVSKLPEQCHNLTKLILENTELKEDPMPTLGKLPSLVILRIKSNVFMGREMVCSSTDFLQLTYLQIWNGLPELENWTVDQGAFPKLSKLEIRNCPKLEIPDGFAFLTALKELDIRGMTQGFVERRMKKGVDGKEGEDYHKLQHIPSIKINGKRLRSDH